MSKTTPVSQNESVAPLLSNNPLNSTSFWAGARLFGQAEHSASVVNMYGSMAQQVGSVRFKRGSRSARCVYHTGMTAIVSAYTKEGFVVGADSLRMDMHGQVVTENAIKIFETQHPDFLGAYGFSGYTAFEFADARPMLDLLESAKLIASELANLNFKGAHEYVKHFCNNLAAKIEAGSTGIALPDDFRLYGMFVGYANGRAVYMRVEFSAVAGYLLPPRLTELLENPVDRFCISSGSQVVWDEMSDIEGPETLAAGVDFVQDYVARCINNSTDPYCASIGGHPQIATITDKGFNWVVRP